MFGATSAARKLHNKQYALMEEQMNISGPAPWPSDTGAAPAYVVDAVAEFVTQCLKSSFDLEHCCVPKPEIKHVHEAS